MNDIPKIGFRNTWAEVSLHAISHNVSLFRSHLHSSCRLMAVVKADGYGHGAVEVARAAIQAGAHWLGVAFLDEALQLRNAGIDHPILVLGCTPTRSLEIAVTHRISLTVFSEQSLDELIAVTARLSQPARIHIKVDTGMSRLGCTSKEEVLSLSLKARSSPYVRVEGIFTHFANADSKDCARTRHQFERFTSVIDYLEQHQIQIPLKHCCNSAATIQFPEMHLDMVRVGISLYGLLPSDEVNHPLTDEFQKAMQFKSSIASLKQVGTDEWISYGCTARTEQHSLIATMPAGYADGLSRLLSNKGFVLVRGQRVPIVGRVCMDQTMLDVTTVPNVQLDDEVVLFGQSQGAHLSMDEMASWINTINYEVVCSVGKRVPRIYERGPLC